MNARFPRSARVRARADFDRIFQHGRRIAAPALALHWQATPQPARLGLAVSRKVDPNAVGRNRIKRALRDSFRRCRSQLADGDYVMVARSNAKQLSGPELVAIFHSLLQRAGALPPSSPPGTMPFAPVTATPASIEPAALPLDPNQPGPTSP